MSCRILVLFGTTEGHTAKVAEAMADELRSRGADVDVVRARGSGAGGPHPEYYDAVIVAGSVHAGGYQRAVARWVRRHAAALEDRPTAFVSVCLGVLERSETTDRELSAILQRFFDKTGWQPDESKIVAGALPYTQYGWLKRWIMRRIVAKAHGDTDTSRDYEYTDWADVADFAGRFADRVHAPVPVAAAG
jgi:menaquinone-dependent protoporphyrinogen oxidase